MSTTYQIKIKTETEQIKYEQKRKLSTDERNVKSKISNNFKGKPHSIQVEMSNNKLSLNVKEIKSIFLKLSYFCLDYYYIECHKQFPSISKYPMSVFCVDEDSSFDLSCMINEDATAFTNTIQNIKYIVKGSKILQKHFIFHLFSKINNFSRVYCNTFKESIKKLDFIENSEYIQSKSSY